MRKALILPTKYVQGEDELLNELNAELLSRTSEKHGIRHQQ